MRMTSVLVAALLAALGHGASAQDKSNETLKIGFIAPTTGQFSQIGNHLIAGAKYYMQEHGAVVAGKNLELLIKDDGGQPDTAKRIAQEYIVNDKVAVLAGFTFTPVALAVAPLSAQAKIPQVVMGAGTSIITERSPYIARTFFTIAQVAVPMAQWAAKNNIKRIVTMVSDYAPGHDGEKVFGDEYKKSGGEVVANLRVPIQNPDFAPYLQRAREANPEAIFVFIPGNQAGTFARQYAERGMGASGIKLIGTGDITDDDLLNGMGEPALGIITSHQYSAAHDSATNKAFVAGFRKAMGMRPNYVSVAAYDGMHLIYEALKKTGGKADGDTLIAAMKGMSFESPRGPITIDPQTRDIVQNVYIRRVEKRDGELYNVEFDVFPAVKDPIKATAK
ncbi:MAG: ABC transporter substrate-binding protein [Alphaproteobacteria bacterium]|nr:ABC transporter substrate-binding protein [Alphaproteobacteria bacterium]